MAINGAVELMYLKAKWGSDVRRTSLRHSHDLTLNDLILMLQRVFNIDQAAAIFLKYRDSEGDLVSLTNDEDVLHALKDGHGSLFVHVFSASEDQKDFLDLEAKLEELQVGVARALDALHSLALAAPPAHATAPKSEIEDDREKTKTFSVASQEEEAEEVEEDVPLNTSEVVQPPPVYSSPKEVAPPKPVVEQQQPHYPPPPTDHQLQHHHQQQQHQQYTAPQAQLAYQAQQQQQYYQQQQHHQQQQQPLMPAYPNWSQAPPPTPTSGFVPSSPPTPATGFVPPPPPTGVSMSGYGGAPNPFAPRQRTSYPLPQQMNGQQQQKTGQLEDVPLNTPYTTPVPPTSTSSPFGAPPTTHAGYQGQQYYSTANYGQNGHAPAAYPSTYNGTL